jgi:hypothetical protein
MKDPISTSLYGFFAIILAGCAGASPQLAQMPPATNRRPSTIVAYLAFVSYIVAIGS